jgi:hypothetical protein
MRARSNLSVLSLAATMFAVYSIFCFHAASVATTGSGSINDASPVSEPLLGDGAAVEMGETGGVATSAGAAFVPIVPALMDYEYADKYLLQFIDNIPGYQLIEAIITESRPPVCVVTITSSGEQAPRTFYTNSPVKAKAIAALGKTVRIVPITYKTEHNLGEQPAFNIALKGSRGEAIRWHFLLASEPTERGGGITQSIPPLGFLHRRVATAAGEGTSVQIGDKVCQAKPWPEVSVVPYFVAYRGVYTVNSILGGLVPGGQSWRERSAPPSREIGSQWVFTEGKENTRQFRIIAKQGNALTIREVFNNRFAVPATLNVQETPQGLAFNSIAFSVGKKAMRLTISPAFNVAGCPEGRSSFRFQIDLAGQPKPIQEGALEVQRKNNVLELTWRASSPSWAKTRALRSRITLMASGYQISSWPDS